MQWSLYTTGCSSDKSVAISCARKPHDRRSAPFAMLRGKRCRSKVLVVNCKMAPHCAILDYLSQWVSTWIWLFGGDPERQRLLFGGDPKRQQLQLQLCSALSSPFRSSAVLTSRCQCPSLSTLDITEQTFQSGLTEQTIKPLDTTAMSRMQRAGHEDRRHTWRYTATRRPVAASTYDGRDRDYRIIIAVALPKGQWAFSAALALHHHLLQQCPTRLLRRRSGATRARS